MKKAYTKVEKDESPKGSGNCLALQRPAESLSEVQHRCASPQCDVFQDAIQKTASKLTIGNKGKKNQSPVSSLPLTDKSFFRRSSSPPLYTTRQIALPGDFCSFWKSLIPCTE